MIHPHAEIRSRRMATWLYQPGNGTRYEFTVVLLPYPIPGDEEPALVWLRHFGAVNLSAGRDGFLHPGYLMEKVAIRAPDAHTVAPAIGWALGNHQLAEWAILPEGLHPEETIGTLRLDRLALVGCSQD
jgi:hypothetical protein